MKYNQKGIYFATKDYAGFIRRFICLIVDLVFILFLLYIIIFIFDQNPEFEFIAEYVIVSWFIFSVIYFSIIKSSEIKTLGYRLFGIKIIDLSGNKPSSMKMLFRFSVSLLDPFELPLDIIWLIDDTNRQTLRDKIAGTYVIKKNAEPIGSNQIVGYYYFIYGLNFFFSEVSRENIN